MAAKRVSQKLTVYGKPLERVEEAPAVPTGGQVLLRVTSAGVCHSDIHLSDGYMDLGGGAKLEVGAIGLQLPLVLGHETVGEVVSMGPDAKGIEVGKRYICYPWIGCGDCGTCKGGWENMCSFSQKVLGVNTDGGYSTHILLPDAKYCIPFSGVSEEFAATLSCSGITAYGAIQKALVGLANGFNDQDKLLIMGAGGLGMQGIKICRALFPGYKPSVADIDPKKREAALAAGAAEAIDPADAAQTGPIAMAAMTGKGGYAAIIDFVGAGATVQGATALLRRGGALIVVGLFGGSMQLSTAMLPFRAWKIQGSYVGSPKEMAELAALAAAGKVEEIPITKRKLEDANAVLEELKAGKIVGRAVLKPNGV